MHCQSQWISLTIVYNFVHWISFSFELVRGFPIRRASCILLCYYLLFSQLILYKISRFWPNILTSSLLIQV